MIGIDAICVGFIATFADVSFSLDHRFPMIQVEKTLSALGETDPHACLALIIFQVS